MNIRKKIKTRLQDLFKVVMADFFRWSLNALEPFLNGFAKTANELSLVFHLSRFTDFLWYLIDSLAGLFGRYEQ